MNVNAQPTIANPVQNPRRLDVLNTAATAANAKARTVTVHERLAIQGEALISAAQATPREATTAARVRSEKRSMDILLIQLGRRFTMDHCAATSA
jgi:hypothetical protein